MNYQHKNLANGRWPELTFFQQMANIGSEVERTIAWRSKNAEYGRLAFERALELIDLTAADNKNRRRLKELFRMREALVDYFFSNNAYKSSDKKWQNYFYGFNYAARLHTA